MNIIRYKNYTAKIHFDELDEIFVGTVLDIQDIIAFHGSSVEELKQSFAETMELYFEGCIALGGEPNIPKKIRRTTRSQLKEKSV